VVEVLREELDRHVLEFPKDGPPTWVVYKMSDNLAEERLAGEVIALRVNRSEKRAHVEPPPVVPDCSCGWSRPTAKARLDRADRRRR
jgi:hypothetical protein